MLRPPRILILANEPTLPADHPDADSEHDILYTADIVGRVLRASGCQVSRLGVTDQADALLDGVKRNRPDAVFNLYEGTARWGDAEAYVCGVLELLRVPYTGSPPKPLMLCRSKPLTKQLLAGAGLPTAAFFSVPADGPVPPCPLPFPVIVKPGMEDASVGIDQKSVARNQAELDERVEYVRRTYGPVVLVERFIRGREFNVAVLERDGVPTPLPFSEILFVPPADAPHLWPIVSFDAKWRPNTLDFKATPAVNPAQVDATLHAEVSALAVRAFELAGCRDYARIDFRVDEHGRPFVLEVNPNPCISPLAGLAAGLESAKVPYPHFLAGLARSALRRGESPELAEAIRSPDRVEGLPGDAPAEAPPAAAAVNPWPIVRGVLATIPAEVCVELLAGGGNAIVGTGREPNVAELRQIAVEPDSRRRGVGRSLLRAAEAEARARGARVLVANVSSAPAFAAARQLLHAAGFACTGEVPDADKDGWSRLTFSRAVGAP